MTNPEIVMSVLLAVLAFLSAWLFNSNIRHGQRITAHDMEIIELRRNLERQAADHKEALAKQEKDLTAKIEKQEKDLRDQVGRAEHTLAAAVGELKGALQTMGHSIEEKVGTLHNRLDTFLIEQAKQAHKS